MQDPKNREKSPSGHHRATLSGYVFGTQAHINNRKKLVKQQYLPTRPHNMVNFGPLVAEIGSLVWGTPTQGCKRDLSLRDRDETKTFGFWSETRPRPRPSCNSMRPRPRLKFTIMWGNAGKTLLFNKFFFPIVNTCLSCEDIAGQSCAMMPRLRFFWVLHFQQAACSTWYVHSKFALRPHHVWKYGRHPISDRWD